MSCAGEALLKGKMLLFLQGGGRIFLGMEVRLLPSCLQAGPKRASPHCFKCIFPVRGDFLFYFSSNYMPTSFPFPHEAPCAEMQLFWEWIWQLHKH